MVCWKALCDNCEVCEGCTRLLKTAFRRSKSINSGAATRKMNLSISNDMGSNPALSEFNKENETSSHQTLLDRTDIFDSPIKAYRSPSKFTAVRQVTSPRMRQPLEDYDPNSQDSGYGASYPGDDIKCGFRFAEPLRMAPRKTPIEPSPRKELTPSPQGKRMLSMFSRSCSSGSESVDDGFMELFMSEKMDEDAQMPTGINSLLSGSILKENRAATPLSPKNESPVVTPFFNQQYYSSSNEEFPRPSFRRCLSTSDSFTPSSSRVRSCLFKSTTVVRTLDTSLESSTELASPVSQLASSALSSLRLSSSGSFKRPEPPCDKQSPINPKRRKSLHKIQENNISPQPTLMQFGFKKGPMPKFQRCFSESEATIKSALLRASSNPDLIGDFSKPFVLPLMDGRHQDLKSISVDTLAALMHGVFKDTVASYTIVDCRYPYEFEGGHIQGAKNYYTKEQILQEFFQKNDGVTKKEASKTDALAKRNILIFHCEFSSERGPTLSRFLRNSDRDSNKECYPALDYPEMYLLNGGYKLFFEKYQELCDPQSYRPMTHPDHESDLRKFRSKSKSWNGGDGKSRLYPRGHNLKRLGL